MGVYTYTFRAKTTKFNIGGVSVPVHHFCYAYKHFYNNSKREEFIINNFHRHADKAFASKKSEFIVMCDDEKGVVEGDIVYRNLVGSSWEDCFALRAEVVGFAKSKGRTFVVSEDSPWYFNSAAFDKDSNLWLEQARQNYLDGGKIKTRTEWSVNLLKQVVSYNQAVANAVKKIKDKEIADDYARMAVEATKVEAFAGDGI